MNFIGHHEVARKLAGNDEDRAYFLGAMLPDFIGMFGVRKTEGQMVSKRLIAGMKLHQATDTVFDDEQAPILKLQRAMIVSFREFMTKWQAVQCARVGKDVLFDGIFFKNEAAMASYKQTMRLAAMGAVGIAGVAEPADRWLAGIAHLEAAGSPDFSDPKVVARCLHKRLTGTPTNFDEGLITRLACSLEEHQATVMEIGGAVTAATVAQLRSFNSLESSDSTSSGQLVTALRV